MSESLEQSAKRAWLEVANLREQVEKLTKERDEYMRDFGEEQIKKQRLAQQLAALAEQNEKLKEALLPCAVFVVAQMESEIGTVSSEYPEVFEWAKAAMDQIPDGDTFISSMIAAKEVLSIPDLATPVLNRIRAEGMRMAAEICSEKHSLSGAEEAIRARAAELEKESGK